MLLACVWLVLGAGAAAGVVLTPPYFNLAEGRRVTATATCGEDTEGPELYCKLVGANADRDVNINLIQGQVCDYCDPSREDKRHPPHYAVDGAETWWQSPPLSRGMKYNEVNLTIDLGQEFHVAYVFIKMGNSPRPGMWVLERSVDNGETYEPWQYFADTLGDCETHFGRESLEHITRDDSVVCETQYSKVVPLEGGEIVVSLLNNRPSANDFFNSTILQEWTRATNVRLRFLRTKTLLGHLMSVARQDPTVTRRYFYSIKDISIGGRCVCNGHADTCDITDPKDPFKLLCRCQHDTCGDNCDSCCKGFEQKAWRQSKSYAPFACEPCNCHGHTEECEYDPAIDAQRLSLDIHGRYDGGGVCQNCRDNTEGINCNRCKSGFYRPYGKHWNETDVCQPCDCDIFYSTGNCAEGTGQCECKPEFTAPNCDSCSFGHFGYPDCRPCECHINGTRGAFCEASGGQCPCKYNYEGRFCDSCSRGFYNFPECLPCECNSLGSSIPDTCDTSSGQCSCKNNYGGRTCDQCQDGYSHYPDCVFCSCDVHGTLPGICDKQTGTCMCKEGYDGPRCDRCSSGYFDFPNCKKCNCTAIGSSSPVCDASGRCSCLSNYAGRTCNQCSPGHYGYPECQSCNCHTYGSIGISCDNEGRCQCKGNYDGIHCDVCQEGFYNFPICEECNCDPAGVVETFAGCGSVPPGELCQCKERVQGRICNECRPLYWDLDKNNPDGCRDCDCDPAGVMGGLQECDTKTGQCICKPAVTDRRCDSCIDGTFNLTPDNIFGCSDCGCDVGGSITNICDKQTGQCICHPRINGRTCKQPLQAHYFPTLYHYQYEAEDGETPTGSPVRYGFDQNQFPDFSWKGYATFTIIQNEILQVVQIIKPSLYRMVLRYINDGEEPILGHITITPDNPNDVEQMFKVLFKPTGTTPSLVTVAGQAGDTPSPMVMNPGQWVVSIKNDKQLLLDYFVLLPAAFYEATILVESVTTPCEIGNHGLCRHFRYPNTTMFDTVRGEGGYTNGGSHRASLQEYYRNQLHLYELGKAELPLITEEQPEIHFDLTISKPGPHVLLINYLTPGNVTHSTPLIVEARSQTDVDKGRVNAYPCPYTTICRLAVTDSLGRIAVFDFDSNSIGLVLKGEETSNLAIDSVVAIPLEKWSQDYQQPKPACVRRNGKCIQALFQIPPDSRKVEFELNNEELLVQVPPGVYDNKTGLITLDANENVVDVTSKVPYPGPYVFVVHYYQPDHPAFEMTVLVHNGQYYEATLPVQHCPSNSGCRSLLRQADGTTNFYLTENFIFTIQENQQKNIWLDYLLVIPFSQYTDQVLNELPVDHTGTFIKLCGQNHFYMDTNTKGFCRDAVFSLTADYNNGALPCYCDYEGSKSFECELFGGQCPCKDNVIGRRCEACKTGYYGFPDCRPCNCPSTALCQANTGECICPSRVMGDQCDKCEPYTYGFDPIIGCEDCQCNLHGVKNGNRQCDLFNGTCDCKPNVVGRTCDHCRAGHWAFPSCAKCSCDLQGTTSEICDQYSSECYCKSNVIGQACEKCKEGTFNLQNYNPDGCTKCFCFGKTSRCSESSLYKTHLSDYEFWSLASIKTETQVAVEPLSIQPERPEGSVGVDLTTEDTKDKIVYFVAPGIYLGNKLASYGGFLNYTIYYTTGLFGSAVYGADVIFHSGDIYLLHSPVEQPPALVHYQASVSIVESSFQLPSGLPATREQLMQTLHKLEGIYIRATYWEASVTTRLSEISLDFAIEDYHPNAELAISVEQCQCPPAYQGHSCEDCAPGHYRSQTGPYGGFCVPCQCNGHSESCDPVTGVCFDCRNNTTGDHCEKCEYGYYGDATQGTQVDCLICACPLPIPSNNFASGCEVSPDGEEISCDCVDGYYGARCESCAAGFYGQPEMEGDYCKPCSCSGNIDPDDPRSCDTVTGECLHCLNNTFGEACGLCRPGFYGDAIQRKDCQSCVCDKCGTKECDSYSGECQCHNNVVNEKCDACARDHYGFSSCQGCLPCDCAVASESTQCDDLSGNCKCKPGVSGRTCDHCTPGYWDYGPDGCVSCGCNTGYSVGFGCNPQTGQCECLPGVIGEKCDHCPDRWVLIENQGCFQCDSCVHDLLDVTDELHRIIIPVEIEFQTVAVGYFTTQRMNYINDTAVELVPKVATLAEKKVNLQPITHEVESLEQDSRSLNRRTEYAVSNGNYTVTKGKLLSELAIDVSRLIEKTVLQTEGIVADVSALAYNLEAGTGGQVDSALADAEFIWETISQLNLSRQKAHVEEQSSRAQEVMRRMIDFQTPLQKLDDNIRALQNKTLQFEDKLADLRNYSNKVQQQSRDATILNHENKNSKINSKVEKVGNSSNEVEDKLKHAQELLKNASALVESSVEKLEILVDVPDQINAKQDELNNTIKTRYNDTDILAGLVENVESYVSELEYNATALQSIVQGTQNNSGSAVGAAKAYRNIAEAINDAMSDAQEALGPAEEAIDLSEGLGHRADESQSESARILEEARSLLQRVQNSLEPELEEAAEKLKTVTLLLEESKEMQDQIEQQLERISTEPLEPTADRVTRQATFANEQANNALSLIQPITENLPEDVKVTEDLPKEADDIKNYINQAFEQIDNIRSNVDNEKLKEVQQQQENVQPVVTEVNNKLDELKKKVAKSREFLNRIKLGVKSTPKTVLQLYNPDSLSQLGTATDISLYFRTVQPNGLLLYLGNEKDSVNKKGKPMNDFLALEVENGYPVLTFDLGGGPEKIINQQNVGDNRWHQAIIKRKGRSVQFIIRSEAPNKQLEIHQQDAVLPGKQSIFNLDQEKSKLFVGGYPSDYKMQDSVKTDSFTGEVEGLMIGNNEVSLWNFVYAEDPLPARERDSLSTTQVSSGLRFDGSGYAKFDARNYPLKDKSEVRLKFKTFAKEGLLFLAGRPDTFMSIELQNGNVVYKYNLGGGVLSIVSPKTYNDGQWYTVEATRAQRRGQLTIDDEKIFSSTSPGNQKHLSDIDFVYFGGYPEKHNIPEVTNVNFDGCIDNVQIRDSPVYLSDNIEAFGVVQGCPAQVSTLLGFVEPGYLHWRNTSIVNSAEINLRFKTLSNDGLLFYSSSRDKSETLALSLVDGALVFNVLENVLSSTIKYNDNEWHVITASYEDNTMYLDIDDIDSFSLRVGSSYWPRITFGNSYFGGVPDDFEIQPGTSGSTENFIGCLGDATINGVFINFDNSTNRRNSLVGSCVPRAGETSTPFHPRPRPPEPPIVGTPDDGTEEGQPPFIIPDRQPPTEEPRLPPFVELDSEVDKDTKIIPTFPPEPDVVPEATPPPPQPTPVGACALPPEPADDPDITPETGIRFGVEQESLIEMHNVSLNPRGRYNISIQFKTNSPDGILLYISDGTPTPKDFVALYMRNGKLIHAFDCGSGVANISSTLDYNDDQWHIAELARHQRNGTLKIDGILVAEGQSPVGTKSLELELPVYVGGVPRNLSLQVRKHLKGLSSNFNGCLRDFIKDGQSKPLPLVPGVVPCSNKIENGAFFYPRGGHIRLLKNFRVGFNMDIEMWIKPRSLSGVLLSVHGKTDFLMLQMINGDIKFTVDNGLGSISTVFKPPTEHYFCDGQWHHISALKVHNAVTLAIDRTTVPSVIGDSTNTATDTKSPVVVGGRINPSARLKGLETDEQFVGCIRNIIINRRELLITTDMVYGSVAAHVCPTI